MHLIMNAPIRPATEEERNELERYVASGPEGVGDEPAAHIVSHASVYVVPDYVTGGPGYSGMVMIVLYDGGPEQCESYFWDAARSLQRGA